MVRHLGKYAYLFSGGELGEKINTTPNTCTVNTKLPLAAC